MSHPSGSKRDILAGLRGASAAATSLGQQRVGVRQEEERRRQRELDNLLRETQFQETKRARGEQEKQAKVGLEERTRASKASESLQASNLELRKRLGLIELSIKLKEARINPEDPNALLIRNALAYELGLEAKDIPTTGIRPPAEVDTDKGGFPSNLLAMLKPKTSQPTAGAFAVEDFGLRPLPGLTEPAQIGKTKDFLPFPELSVTPSGNSFEIDFRKVAQKGITKNRVKSLKERFERQYKDGMIPDDRIKGERALANAEAMARKQALPFPDLGGGPPPVEDQAADLSDRLPLGFRDPRRPRGTTSDLIPGKTIIGGTEIDKPDIPALVSISPSLATKVEQASILTPFQLDAAVLEVELLANKGKITPFESTELLSFFGSIRFENMIGISGATGGVPLGPP